MQTGNEVKTMRDEERWELEVTAEIPADVLERYRAEALKELQKTANLQGFRPGHAPIERIEQVYGDAAIMRRVAEDAIRQELPEILAKAQAPIVETPRVETGSPERGKPLPFTARAGLAPEVKLPDYRAIARSHNEKAEAVGVSDEEHAQALTHLRRERARVEKMEQGADPQKAADESRTLDEKDLPALDDAFVRSIGYENLDAFQEALRTNMRSEKENQARQKRRNAILDDIATKATIRYPAIMKEYELDDMEGRLSDDLSRMGASLDSYLAETKKTRDELRKEWGEGADKRAKIRLILNDIARAEKIEADPVEIEREVSHTKEHYPDANLEQLKAGVAHALRNEAVMRFLDTLQ